MYNNPFYRAATSNRHKLFVSFHHKDEAYRQEFDLLFGDLFISKSVGEGEIPDENSDEYVKRLIREGYISDASVVVVLVGPRTYCRKHVDWEISAGLNRKANGYSGLLGIRLPNRNDLGRSSYEANTVPPRLVDNLQSGYARFYDWTISRDNIRKWVDEAFAARVGRSQLIDNSRNQFVDNRCD
jgi:hypothetical protein